jgi:hypothetical protein
MGRSIPSSVQGKLMPAVDPTRRRPITALVAGASTAFNAAVLAFLVQAVPER